MYLPAHFALKKDDEKYFLKKMVDEYPLATFIHDKEVDLVPCFMFQDKIYGHVASSNPLSEKIKKGQQIQVIISGPNCYISPVIYGVSPHVPTWNYALVQLKGTLHEIMDQKKIELLTKQVELTEKNNETNWSMSSVDPSFIKGLLAAITFFELKIISAEFKFKMSQNRTPEIQKNVIKHLSSGDEDQKKMAEWMKEILS